MKIDVYNQKGKKTKTHLSLPIKIFGCKVRLPLLAQATRVYLSNQRQGTAHTKTRGERSGSGRKPWANNKVGRARTRDRRNPIWRGGGIVFGPRKEKNYKLVMPKKMRRQAIFSAFSLAASENRIVVVDKIELEKERLTKQVESIVSNLPVDTKILFIQPLKDEALIKGASNLRGVYTTVVGELNAYKLLSHKYLIILADAVEEMKKLWKVGESKEVKKSKEDVKREEKQTEKKVKVQEKVVEEKKDSIEGLKLSDRVEKSLLKAGIKDVESLSKKIEKNEKIVGIGEKGIKEIKSELKRN